MACEDLGYREFTQALEKRLGNRRAPLGATIGLTDRCNLRCVHCFVHDPAQDHLLRTRELQTEQWFDIFDQLAEAGCIWMLWTGGEILLRTDFVDLYRYAKQKGFLITLFTNGTLLTPDLIALLQEWYPVLVEVSLYGLTPETYEKVTGVGGAYERCMAGIHGLVEAGVPLRLKSMAMTLTKEELPAMYEFAADLGVQFYHDGMIWQPFHDKDIRHLRLSPEEVVALDDLHPLSESEFRRVYHRHKQILATGSGYDPERLYNCGAGFRSFYIDPYGGLGLCQAARPTLYDLTKGTFREGWKALGEYRENTRAARRFPCMDCEIAGVCRRCAARSIQEHGEPEAVVEFACEVAHLRVKHYHLDDDGENVAGKDENHGQE